MTDHEESEQTRVEKQLKIPNHLRSLHDRDQEKRLIVVLENASLETAKVKSYIFRSILYFRLIFRWVKIMNYLLVTSIKGF